MNAINARPVAAVRSTKAAAPAAKPQAQAAAKAPVKPQAMGQDRYAASTPSKIGTSAMAGSIGAVGGFAFAVKVLKMNGPMALFVPVAAAIGGYLLSAGVIGKRPAKELAGAAVGGLGGSVAGFGLSLPVLGLLLQGAGEAAMPLGMLGMLAGAAAGAVGGSALGQKLTSMFKVNVSRQ
jgi:hypothetical protein